MKVNIKLHAPPTLHADKNLHFHSKGSLLGPNLTLVI